MVIHHEKMSWKSTGDVDFDHPSLKVNILTQCHLKDWKQIHSAHVNPIADVVFRRCSNHVQSRCGHWPLRRRCQFPLFGTASFGFGWPPGWGWAWPEWLFGSINTDVLTMVGWHQEFQAQDDINMTSTIINLAKLRLTPIYTATSCGHIQAELQDFSVASSDEAGVPHRDLGGSTVGGAIPSGYVKNHRKTIGKWRFTLW